MSVTQYEIPCGYELSKLKNTVYFLSKDSVKNIEIDNGEAYAAINDSVSPNQLKGFNVKLTETESLDERYVFTKQLTMSITGHLTDSAFLLDDDYYIVVQTEDGTYYLVNVDFPSKMSFVYNLSEGQDQTDFTFVSNSNHPTLKLNWNPVTWNTCQTYQVYGIDSLKLLEKDYTTIDGEQGVINLFDGHEFKDVDYLKNTISLQENYDGKIATTTISFEIPFNNYKPSWQYNLLEFDQNLYVAHITPKNSDSGIFAGYEHGLQPSYEINGNTSIGESTSIKITLTEASEWGIFELDTWSYYRDSSKRWVGIDSEVKCIGLGVGINTLMEEVDGNGTPTGRYKCLEGYESEYTNYNIITSYTESDVESFRTSVCTRFRTRDSAPTGYYTCINGDKYELLVTSISYDGGKAWVNSDDYTVGEMVESASSFCEIEPEYEWRISEEWECIEQFVRWIPSGTTCILGDKYQNNYKQVSDDNVHWVDSNPLEWSASTVIEYDSEDCKIYKWSVVSGGYECSGTTKMTQEKLQESIDGGSTWTDVIPLQTRAALPVIEEFSSACGFMPPSSGDYLTFIALEDAGFYAFDTYCNNEVSYSMDGGATWIRSNRTGNIKKGDVVLWKGECRPCMKNGDPVGIGEFAHVVGKFNVGGNIMSLVYGDNFSGQTSLSGLGDYLFLGLFSYNQIVSAEHLYLPATTLANHCYEYMFRRCSSLVTPPQELPAITLVDWCYYGMFDDCASLTKTPQMQPIHLAYACCGDMFIRCASLTTVPNELPATTLANDCYVEMFRGCTSLTTAPILPAGTLPENCYAYMFSGCTSLNSITCLATNIEDDWCTIKWVEGVAANGVFTRNSSMTSWTTGVNGIPRGWTVHVYNP